MGGPNWSHEEGFGAGKGWIDWADSKFKDWKISTGAQIKMILFYQIFNECFVILCYLMLSYFFKYKAKLLFYNYKIPNSAMENKQQ